MTAAAAAAGGKVDGRRDGLMSQCKSSCGECAGHPRSNSGEACSNNGRRLQLRSERASAVAVVMLFSDVLCHCPLHHTIVSSAPTTVHGQGSTQRMNYWCVAAASGGGHSVRPEGLRRLALCMDSGYIFKHVPQPPSGRTWAPTTSGASSRLSFVVPLFPHHRSYHLNNCFTFSPRSHLFVTNTLLGTPANSLSAVS